MTGEEHLLIPFGGACCCYWKEFILRMQFSGAWPSCKPSFLQAFPFCSVQNNTWEVNAGEEAEG